MSRTQEEINEMISKIQAQKDIVPEFSAFGHRNWDDYEGGIRVLQDNLDIHDVADEYEPDDEDSETYNYMITVCEWVNGADNESELLED